jgi:hypothetical protein
MAASKPALTDPAGLVALLYRADWTPLCLSAEFSTWAERPRVIRKPGEDSWRRADEGDEKDPRETWRLATEAPDSPEVQEDEEDEDYADGLPPHWRDGLTGCSLPRAGGIASRVSRRSQTWRLSAMASGSGGRARTGRCECRPWA